jgi:hypothetical protein
MKLDWTLAREIRSLGGNGSRGAKFELLRKIDAARSDLSTPQVMTNFDDGLHFSRVCEYARSFILATSEEG